MPGMTRAPPQNRQKGAGDELREIGGEEGHGMGDVGILAPVAQGERGLVGGLFFRPLRRSLSLIIQPGATWLTVIPCSPISRERTRSTPSIPRFAGDVGPTGWGRCAARTRC